MSVGLQAETLTEAAENLKDLAVEDPKEVVARKETEDRENMKKLSQDLQGKEVVERSLVILMQDRR